MQPAPVTTPDLSFGGGGFFLVALGCFYCLCGFLAGAHLVLLLVLVLAALPRLLLVTGGRFESRSARSGARILLSVERYGTLFLLCF